MVFKETVKIFSLVEIFGYIVLGKCLVIYLWDIHVSLLHVYVMRKAWICAIHGLRCAKYGLCGAKGAKLEFVQNMDWPKLKCGYDSIAPLPSFVVSMKFC